MAIGFAVQGEVQAANEWVDLARRAEALGFDALCAADHPGTTASPFVALAAAAQATTRLRLATAVVNAGAWQPVALAAEIATLDVVSNGRAVFGIGTGHTPSEWTMTGRPFPSVRQRLAHLSELVDAVRRLLAGDHVTVDGDHVVLHDAVLAWPNPPRGDVPLLVGGNGRRVLRYGASCADMVELTGLGPTLPDGHFHVPDWSQSSLRARVDLVAASIPPGRPAPRLGALVQRVEVTDDRVEAADAFRGQLCRVMPAESLPSLDDLLATPYLLLGTEQQIVDQLVAQRHRWGFTRYTVRAGAVESIAPIIEHLPAN